MIYVTSDAIWATPPWLRTLRSGVTVRSGPAEWIIQWIARKRKLANPLSYSEHWIHFHIIYYPLYMLIIWYLTTPIVCLTPARWYDSGCISWLRSHLPTPVDVTTSVTHHSSGRCACHMSYHLSYERLRMARLDDYIILQPGHLVGSRLGGTHDSFSVWNHKHLTALHVQVSGHVPRDQWTLSTA
jgi:hypothetical protein